MCSRCAVDGRRERHGPANGGGRPRIRTPEETRDKKAKISRVEWARANPARMRALQRRSWLRWKYGITPEEYDDMLASQGGVCAICGRVPAEGKYLHVDHDHETGRIRGLLCAVCNRDVGRFEKYRDRFLRYLGIDA